MLRGLIYHRGVNAAVALAVAVCAAVLTGALLVGDSVRGSLRDLTLDRLGNIDLALVAERFFDDALTERLAASPGFDDAFDAIAPAVLLRGSAQNASTRARASRVEVLGVDERFVDMFRAPPTSRVFAEGARSIEPPSLIFDRADRQVFPSVIVNEALATELSVTAGDALLLYFRLGAAIPRDTVLGDRETGEVVGSVRAVVGAVIPDRNLGRFALDPHQTFPFVAYMSLSELQRAVEQPGRINALLVSRRDDAASVAPALDDAVTLADMGLEIVPAAAGGEASSVLEVRSEQMVLPDPTLNTIDGAAGALGVETLQLQAYLANEIRGSDGAFVPYSMVMGIDSPATVEPFGRLELRDGTAAPALADDEILLNEWTAGQLDVSPGAEISLAYYVVGADEELRTERADFRLAGVVRMDGLAVDRDLMPPYPGIEGVDDIASWDPPFPVDLGRIRPADEQYWDDYRGAPKAFVSSATGRRLWATRYGAVTSVRLGAPGDAAGETGRRNAVAALRERLQPAAHGFSFIDVKRQGLEASAGATDFGGLFIGFSFFIILSAALIVGMLFALGIEQRAGEVGLLLAVGYPLRRVRGRLLAEGALVGAVGAAVGLLGAVLYGRLMLLGLTTLWLPAVGSPLLFLYVEPLTLFMGWAISLLVALLAIWLTVRRLRRVPTTRLLAGAFLAADVQVRRRRRRAGRIAIGAGSLALATIAWGVASGAAASPAVTFGAGALLLTAGLAGFAAWCNAGRGRLARGGGAAAVAMAMRNSGWSPGRSVLSVALVASAAFVIVTVAGNVRNPQTEADTVEEGAGGYVLMATSDVPLHDNLNTTNGRSDLGLPEDGPLATATITQLRLLPGDDASCLNLYRPQRPRILGIPAAQVERGGFHFAASLADELGVGDNAWEMLDADLGPGVIPAIGDANSVQWILHLGLGDELALATERGETVSLQIVGTLSESIFQSELLISEANFLRLFPSRSGFSYFLIDAPADSAEQVAAILEDDLAPFGFDTTSTAQKLAGYLVVQNTYLSTFQMLGGLGLLLGTIGLGVVLVRNVIERRGELATLRAFGFQRSFLGQMVLAENAFLLVVGLAIGTLSAAMAISPRYLLGAVEVPWTSLLPTLCAVLVVGMLASVIAVAGALRVPLLPALKRD
jgi:ABC-type antimicrobial peptide transport system permease subunit